jgi:hypothetical protein
MTEQWKVEHDQRQFEQMITQIARYEDGATNLASLIAALDALLEALEGVEDEWKSAFRAEWWTLEQVYAVALDQGQMDLPLESRRFVSEAIENMKHLLPNQQHVTAVTDGGRS